MVEDKDSVRLTEKSVDNAMISQHHLPLKKRRTLTQPETPEHPNSPSEIAKNKTKNKTPKIDVYAKRPADANRLQEQLGIKKLVFDSNGVKKSVEETPQVDEYEYHHQLEWEARRRPLPDYIEKVQKEFTVDMRSIFVDWLVKVAEKIELPSDIMHLTVSCIDRYLSVNVVDRQRLKLLGVSSMLISLKYEYNGHSCESDLYKTIGTEFTKLEIAKMENEILKSLEIEMGNTTVKTFLRKFTRVAHEEVKVYKVQMEFLCDYLADLSLLEYKCLKFSPSLVAASVVFLSRYTIRPNSHPWSSAFQQESGYEPANLKECVLLIHDWQTSRRGGGILNAVRNKYKNHEFKYVSELSSPETIPAFFFGDATSMGDEEVSVQLAKKPPIKKLVIKLKTPNSPQPLMFTLDGVKKAAKKTSGVDRYKYLHHFPSQLRSFVTNIMNVPADGNCGFRAIADFLGFGIDSHRRIRGGLFHELISNIELYREVFIDRSRVEKVLHILNFFREPAPKEHWFCLPDMGYLVASRYNVALVCIDLQMPVTFLPLRTPIPKEPKLICIGIINDDHFVKVNLVEGCPLPPVAGPWYTEHDGCSKGWLDFYQDRFKEYMEIVYYMNM